MSRPSLTWRILARLRRLTYSLEKGRPHATGIALLVIMLALILVVSAASMQLYDIQQSGGASDNGFGYWLWWALAVILDPGAPDAGELAEHSGVELAVGLFLALIGLVFFGAFLIAGVTSLVATGLERLRHGGFDVAFYDHVVILGWNVRVFAVLEALFERDPGVHVAILGELDKPEADEALDNQIFAELDRRRGWRRHFQFGSPRRQVVFRNGNPLVPAHLDRVGAGRARTFILLMPPDREGLIADAQALRTHMAVVQHRERLAKEYGDRDPHDFRAVGEISDDRFRVHTLFASGIDPRSDGTVVGVLERAAVLERNLFLPAPKFVENAPSLALVNPSELISRALVQCAVQPRISGVLELLLDFRATGLQVIDQDQLVSYGGGTAEAWAELLGQAASKEVRSPQSWLAQRIEGAQLIGMYEPLPQGGGRVHFELQTRKKRLTEWPLIFIGPYNWSARSGGVFRIREQPLPAPTPVPTPRLPEASPTGVHRVLVLGHNRLVTTIVEQFDAFTDQYPSLELEVSFAAPDLPATPEALMASIGRPVRYDRVGLHLIHADYTDWASLGAVLNGTHADSTLPDGERFDSIVLLGTGHASGAADEADAAVIMAMVMLRAFRNDPRWRDLLRGTAVVAELIDPTNRELFRNDAWLTDSIVGPQYVSRFIAQVVWDDRLEDVLLELLRYGHRELYLRAPEIYGCGEAPLRWLDVIAAAEALGETALGYQRIGNSLDDRFVSPGAEEPVVDAERIVVLAAD